jgi:hypothetical protein
VPACLPACCQLAAAVADVSHFFCLDCWPVAAAQPVLMLHCATLPCLLLDCSGCWSACRYILFAAEEQGFELPFACRLGCCTACTVKVKEGSMYQPHSLGLSNGLRDLVSTSSCNSSPGHVAERVLGSTAARRAVGPHASPPCRPATMPHAPPSPLPLHFQGYGLMCVGYPLR